MRIAIEDNYNDVLVKAAVGLRLGHGSLAVRSNLSLKEVRSLVSGEFDERALRKVASVLSLDGGRLVAMAQNAWYPDPVEIEGLQCFNTPFPAAGYEGASVNNFLVFDPGSREAVVFDTGANADEMLAYIGEMGLRVKALLLTHTHCDHVPAYAEIEEATGCPNSYTSALEPYADAQHVSHGQQLQVSSLNIETRLTNGHSRGGLTYVVNGLSRQIAIVGDSLFCLSIGGAKQAFALALKNNREQILTLSKNTVVCPGHGPMTTVGEELAHNPFFS